MTIDEALERVNHIARTAGDDEAAHYEEYKFRGEVLQCIADGSDQAKQLASIALRTADIDSCRWCA